MDDPSGSLLPILSLSSSDQDLILNKRLTAIHEPGVYEQALSEIHLERRQEVEDVFRHSIQLDLQLAHADLLWLAAAAIIEISRSGAGARVALALQVIDNCSRFYNSDEMTPFPTEHYRTFERPGWTCAGL